MKIDDIIKATDCCFRINKQHAMLMPHCEECPYFHPRSTDCVETLVKDIKENLSLVPQLLFETNEQQTELNALRSSVKPESK